MVYNLTNQIKLFPPLLRLNTAVIGSKERDEHVYEYEKIQYHYINSLICNSGFIYFCFEK